MVNQPQNDIPERQADDWAIGLQRARYRKYRNAKVAQGVFVTIALILPFASALTPSEHTPAISAIALMSVFTLLLDIGFLEPQRKRLMKEAATIQELFDCEVLSLPWRQSVAGRKPEYEDIQPYAATPLRPERESHLKSWYEPCVASVPLVYGRLICQRANICYDIRLRKVYKKLLLWGAVGLTAFAFVIGVATNLAFRDMVLSVFVPVAPMLGWVIREHRSQIETIISLQQLKDAFDELWEKALRGDGDLDIESGARDLQDRIFQHRTNNPLIFDWIYDLLRKENEDGTRAAAEQLVGQVQRVLNKESAA